jgi:CheY-like chemotaxis protein
MPIIFITAHASEEDVRSRALGTGAVGYLAKPLNEDALMNAVHSALNGKDERQWKRQ